MQGDSVISRSMAKAIVVPESGRDHHHFTIFAAPDELLTLVTGSPVYLWDERHDM